MKTLVVLLAGCSFHGGNPTGQLDAAQIDAAPDPFQDAPGTGTDAAPGTVCFGHPSSPWQVCLASNPTGDVPLSGTIDTDHDARCLQAQPTGWYPAQPSSCFIVGDTISIAAGTTVRAKGKKPLVLLATTTITIAGTLDAGSHRASDSGAGAGSMSCAAWPASPKNGMHGGGGGGAGGTFMTKGGDGGSGDNGKGAINVSGAGGDGNGRQSGGDGGGSGGMIVLYAPDVTATTLIANGGGGASGGTSQANGSDGVDGALPLVPATGGMTNAHGGRGYALAMDAGAGQGAGTGDGGGGGGGGGGYILANKALVSATISPAPTFVQ